MKEGDEHKAAFKTPKGSHEPMVMHFGFSPATFQCFINDASCAIITKHAALGTVICIYMDDIAIATMIDDEQKAYTAHVAAITDVLTMAWDNDLRPVLQTREMHLPCQKYRLPGGNPWGGGDSHGPGQNRQSARLAHTNLS